MMLRFMLLMGLLWPFSLLADLRIQDAWIKHLPAAVPVRAGYMTLENPGVETITIVDAASEAFGSVEIHQTIKNGDMMSMRPVDRLTIGPQETVRLKPGGIHLMLMQATHPTEPGQQISLTLKFADGRQQRVVLTIKK